MNIVYLIGNGFDRNLNLNTDYRSFYKYYIKQVSPSPIINQLKSEIDSNYENWADLEEALGKYLNKVSNKEDAILIHQDLLGHLQNYICGENEKLNPQKSYAIELLNELFSPIRSLRKNLQNKLSNGILRKSQTRNLYVITFNYTETLEKLLNYKGMPILAFSYGANDSYLLEIEHIHGFCNPEKGRMALGLDNENQIQNTALSTSKNVCYRYLKPIYNNLFGEDHHKKCLKWISEADFICIFGMSIGISDSTWWKAIGKRLKSSNANLLYFYYNGFELQNNNAPEFQEQIDSIKDNLLPKLDIEDISNEEIRDRIYISCDKTIFKYGALKKTAE